MHSTAQKGAPHEDPHAALPGYGQLQRLLHVKEWALT